MIESDINVVISAAGMGTRLGLDIPKCLVSINGETLLARQLKQTQSCGTIYLVVGFKEELVIEEAIKYRKDVIIVRNPQYAQTSNACSLNMGSQYLLSFLALDGDIWFPNEEMINLLYTITNNQNQTILFATDAKSEDSVFMKIDNKFNCIWFSRKEKTFYEWSGCGWYVNKKISQTAKYVFEEMEQYLPLQASIIKCWEVDTPQDLDILKNL